MGLQRVAVNPTAWLSALGFSHGVVVSGQVRTLYCSGQTAMSGAGELQHPGDMAGQLSVAMDNLEALLVEAEMGIADLVRVVIYTTDVDLFVAHHGGLVSRLAAAGVAPATTLLGVTRLLLPGQLVELEGTAVA